MLVIGVLNVIIVNLGRLLSSRTILAFLYLVFASFVFVYAYSFWGAYLRAIVFTYSEIYQKDWLIIILCIVSLLMWAKYTVNQINEERNKLRIEKATSENPFIETFPQTLTVIALKISMITPISFIFFMFTDDLYNSLYKSLPEFLSGIFL